MLDALFKHKYELFSDILEHSCLDFQRELVLNFSFRYYSADHPGQENPNIFSRDRVDLPIIERAFEDARYIHFIINGKVHMMDHAGMYDYGIIQKGSYFGDVSVILQKPNEFSYLYDPNYGEAKPLYLFRIPAKTFMSLLDRYPLEKENWIERAKKRQDFFQSYKALTLLKTMKSVVKNPAVIR